MNVLFASFADPLRLGGDELQMMGLVRGLAAAGHACGWVSSGEPAEAAAQRDRLAATGLFPPRVRVVAREGFRPTLSDDLRAAAAGRADVTHAQSLRAAYFVPRSWRPPVLVDRLTRHNALSVRHAWAAERSPAGVARAAFNVAKTARIERAVLTRSPGATFAALSPADAATLRRLAAGSVVGVAPAVCPLAPADLRPAAAADGPTLPLYGSMAQKHNRWALRVLVERVLPAVRRRFPAARLRVTGVDASPDLVADLAARPGVEWVPTVADIGRFLATADVACLPFDFGSGFKTKVAECMAAGLPVVTTPEGVRGQPRLAQAAGVQVVRDLDRLAAAVCEWYARPDAREIAWRENRQVIRDCYSPAAKAASYLVVYQRLAAANRTGRSGRWAA